MLYRNQVWMYPNFLTDEECERIKWSSELLPWKDGMIGQHKKDKDAEDPTTGKTDSSIRKSDVKWFHEGEMVPEIQEKIAYGINQANAEAGWNLQWNYMEPHQYTVYHHRPDAYTPGDHYTWHLDQFCEPTPEGRYRKLSSTIQLSDPDDYEGGDFEYIEYHGVFDRLGTHNTQIDIASHKKTIPFTGKQKGTLIVFPSDTYHQVTPVLRGTRISLVSWFHGPKVG